MHTSIRKKQLLSRYLKDFKHKQTNCSHCDKELDRVSLVLRNQLINKKSIGSIDKLIDDEIWSELQQELIPLCRFCSEILCNTNANYFDIKAFTHYLIEQTEVRHSTMREYVIRLRRLDEILVANSFPMERFSELRDGMRQQVCDYLPDIEQNIYRSALRKYDQYLDWQRHF